MEKMNHKDAQLSEFDPAAELVQNIQVQESANTRGNAGEQDLVKRSEISTNTTHRLDYDMYRLDPDGSTENAGESVVE